MVRNFGRQSRIIVIFLLLSILPTVTAHGGEEEAAALSNTQVLMIASLAAILVYFLVNKFLAAASFPNINNLPSIIYRIRQPRRFKTTHWWYWSNGIDCVTHGHQFR